MGGKLQPAHQALNNRPVHRRYQKDRCYKRHKPSRTSSPKQIYESSQAPRPEAASALRKQNLRIATECFEAVQDDPIEDPDQLDTGAVPAPSTPPFPPPAAVSNENSADLHDVILLIESLHKALGGSHLKIEGLLQQTSTLLATQHEAMTASISSCKQQMDVLESWRACCDKALLFGRNDHHKEHQRPAPR